MATTRDLINKTLRGLRQYGLIIDAADTETSDDYIRMLLQFVNEAKEEVEEAGWSWQALRQTVTVAVVAGQVEYDITIAADADVDTNDRTRLLYENVTQMGSSEGFFDSTSARPQVFDVTDSTEHRLVEWNNEKVERHHMLDNNETQTILYAFSIYSDSDSVKLKLFPTPAANRTLKLRMYIPQAELAENALGTTISIPSRPIWTLSLLKANQERGDELGKEGSTLHLAYLNAHGAAVAREQSPSDMTVGLDR